MSDKQNTYVCIVTGEEKYIPPSLAKGKIQKYGSVDAFREHYVSPAAAKLLRQGHTVDEIRDSLNISGLPKIKPIILTRLNLMRKKRGLRAAENEEQVERTRYLNSKEFRDKRRTWEERQENMTFQDWVETYTGTGRHRGGTCIRPDIFLTHNNRACDGCECYKFCMCYNKRLSHEKRKPKRR